MTGIADRERVEETLHIFEMFTETSNQGMGFAKIDGEIIFANQALSEILGFENGKDVQGEYVFSFYPEGTKKRLEEEVIPRVLSEGAWTGESQLMDINGNVTPVIENVFLIRDEQQQPLYLANVITDISKHKEYEGQLLLAKEQAEAATREKSEFLANMSHEIRTPMNGLIGFIGLLQKTELDDEQHDYVNTIKTTADDLLVIINDILDFSRIEAGKLSIRKIPFDLWECVSDVVQVYSQTAEGKGNGLLMQIDSGVPHFLLGDPLRIRQVLGNLVSNAIKFTENGSISVSVSLEQRAGDRVQICFSVTDTGIGIPEEDRVRLFKAFTQVDRGYQRRYSGTGLGLTISRNLVQQMDGEIGVNSTPGKGSTFWFRLPSVAQQGIDLQRETESLSELGDFSGYQVLVVDDNDINRKLITTLLQKRGVEVQQALNGVEAVEMATKQQYDLILMDIRMPDMDGMEATSNIRTHEKDRFRTPVIALTAHVLPEELEQFVSAGIDECLTKPVLEEELWRLFKKWV